MPDNVNKSLTEQSLDRDRPLNLGGVIQGFPTTPIVEGNFQMAPQQGTGGKITLQDLWNNTPVSFPGGRVPVAQLPYSSIYIGDRYKSSRPYEDSEELYARGQSTASKFANGIMKMVGTGSTAFLSGTAGLVYGAGDAIFNTHKFSSVWNNQLNQGLDEVNKKLEDALPNYYTHVEQDSEWWQSSNLLTANFFSDKLIKNFGYSLGALAGGMAWSKVLSGIGAINGVVKAGKGLEAVQAVESAMSQVPKLQKLGAFENALSSLAQKYVKSPIASVINNGERVTTAFMGTMGEASMEALQNANSFRKNAIDDYIKQNGYGPSGADLEKIEEFTERVGNFSWGMNVALLTGTNYIQLPKILGSSRKADKLLINEITKDAETGLFSAYKPTTKVGRILSGTKGVAGLLFSPSEAFEEGSQFAIQTGTQDFFNRAYRDPKSTSDFMSDLTGALGNISTYGIEQAFNTKEGIENMLIGGLSGGLQQAGFVGTYKDKEGKTKFGIGKSGEIGERGVFGTGGERAANTDIAVRALNQTKLSDILKDRIKYVGIALNSQKLRQEAIRANDTLAEKDFEHDFVLSYVMPRTKYGREASVQQELSLYQSQATTTEGYNELITSGIANGNESKEQFINRIENLKKISKSVSNLYESLNDRYENAVDEQGKKKYSDYAIDKMVYAAAKINNYDERIPLVNAKLVQNGINTLAVLQSMIGEQAPNAEATKNALDQINNLKSPEGLDVPKELKDTLKGDLIDVMELAERRRKFINEYDAIKESPDDYEDLIDEEEDDNVALIKQLEKNQGDKRARTISKEVEVGKEYSLIDPFRREGSQLQLAPKMTVLSKTLGGEYEVKLPNGETTFLTPNEFKDYKVTDSDNTDQGYADILDTAIDKVLSKAKYNGITIPEGEDKIAYINSLNNSDLARDIQKEFNTQSEAYTKIKAEENAALEDENLADELIEITNPDNTEEIADNENEAGDDSRKPDRVVISGSIASKKIPGYQRSVEFANKFYNIPENVRKNLYAVFVTAKNQAKLIPGLVEYLAGENAADATKIADVEKRREYSFSEELGVKKKEDGKIAGLYVPNQGEPERIVGSSIEDVTKKINAKYNAELAKLGKSKVDINTTIAAVIVEKQPDGTSRLVGADGKILEAGQNPLENAIFQVMPLEGLKWSGEFNDETMFRDDTNKEQYKAIYAKRREKILANEDLVQRGFDVSFGIVQDKIDNTTPVKAAGFVTDSQLEDGAVLTIPTTGVDVLAKGTTSFNKPQGMVFLDQPNGYVRLYTSKLTNKQANAIYDVLLSLSQSMMKNKGITDEAESMINWLRTTLQWGSPKEGKQPGKNSVWFAKDAERKTDRLRLNFGAAKIDMSFKPSVLKQQKDSIIEELLKLNHNVNKKQTEDVNETYTEITGVSTDGKLETKEWQNYQTYLLSSEGRSEEDIPLTTKADAIADSENGINRDGNYFIMKDFEDDEEFAPTPKKTVKKTAAPAARKSGLDTFGFKIASTGDVENVDYRINTDQSVTITDSESNNTVFEKLANDELTLEKFKAKYDELYEEGKFAVTSDELENVDIVKQVAQERIEDSLAQKAAIEEQEAKQQRALAMLQAMDADRGLGEEEEAPEEEVVPEVADKSAARALRNKMLRGNKNYDARVRLNELIKNFKGEDWAKVEEWLNTNLPGLPVTRVKTILRNTNGKQFWGAYKDGAIYVYNNAESGTVYHEVFHAVFEMMTSPKERATLRDEFRRRKGSFVDRPTGETIKYSEATDDQIKEQLPEEFKEYIEDGTVPPKPTEGRSGILGVFQDLIDIIKKFFSRKDVNFYTEELFKKINTGGFRTFSPNANTLSLATKGITDIDELVLTGEYDPSLVTAGLTPDVINDIMQEMTYGTLGTLSAEGKDLFEIENLDKKDLFQKLKANLDKIIYDDLVEMANASVEDGTYTQDDVDPILADAKALRDIITNKWDVITKKFEEEYLSSYSVKFDQNDEDEIRNEEKTGKEGTYSSPDKVDSFRKASAAVKLFLATVPVKNPDGSNRASSIGGVNLVPMGKVYIDILNNVSGAVGIDDMLEKFRLFTQDNPQYKILYSRLTNKLDNNLKLNPFQNIKTDGQLRMIDAFFKTFNLQKPDVKTTYILANGEVSVGDTSLASVADQVASQIEDNIIDAIKDGKFFGFNGKSFVQKRKDLMNVPTGRLEDNIDFMADLGVIFDADEIKKRNLDARFIVITTGIRDSLLEVTATKELNGKTLGINGRLRELGEIQAMIENPDFQTTYFNIDGDQVQSYIGQNLMSDFYNVINSVTNKEQLRSTKFSYLLTDKFSGFSVLMDRIFNSKTGDKKQGANKLLKVGYTGGVINEMTGKDRASGSLLYSERLVEELNLNLKGFYMNLVPGDSSLGWTLALGNSISYAEVLKGNSKIQSIFKGYLDAEIAVSREKRKGLPDVKGRKSTDLRFFKGILGQDLHDKVVKLIQDNKNLTIDEVYDYFTNEDTNVNSIEVAIDKYIETDINARIKNYTTQGLISERQKGVYFIKNIEFKNKTNLNLDQLKNNIKMLSVNYMINNIELHKLIYSDPYLYEDELKRLKNFSSPAQDLISGSKDYNNAQNKISNEDYMKGDIGYTDETKDSLSSVVFDDVDVVEGLPGYKGHVETDGGGIIMMKANRRVRKRAGNWNKYEEKQYRYDVAWEKRDKGLDLSDKEEALLEGDNPKVASAYTPLKPIARGRKANNKKYNDIMLDKFALYVYSYRILKQINPTSNALKMYDKMQKGNVDYGVFRSGRKVGAEKTIALYNANGTFNSTPVAKNEITEVPFGILAIQSDVPSKDDEKVRRGTQVTKLVTLDFLDAGLPSDFMPDDTLEERVAAWKEMTEEQKMKNPTYRMVRHNDNLVKQITDNKYQSLLKQIGYKDGKLNLQSLGKYLRKQVIKGNTNENILKAVDSLIAGNQDIEATPAYQQIVNTLYSIAQNTFAAPKMTGGMKVQISSAMLESVRAEVKEINGKKTYASSVLKFYRNAEGERVCEVMVRKWFKTDMSDEELLKYLNTTDEGKKLLSGVGFRIPTQKQNSIDRFVVAKFLPQEFGDSIVVPSALVEKAGSDFDIDKLSIYLKNVYIDKDGMPRYIPYFGENEAEAKRAISKFLIANKLSKIGTVEVGEDVDEDEEFYGSDVDKFYTKSIENEYIASMEDLISSEQNFARLIKPNSAKLLKDLSKKIVIKKFGKEFDYTNTSNLLNQTFMSTIRDAFVRGKYAIGIAAQAQTNHALNQRDVVIVDHRKYVVPEDASWLGDKKVKFSKYNKFKIGNDVFPLLSRVKDANNEHDISDIIGMFIDGYVDIAKGPWIMELGANPTVAPTWLFLVKIGVPIEEVANFMNQPIINDYLKELQNLGSAFLFSREAINKVRINAKYRVGDSGYTIKDGIIPSGKELSALVGKTALNDKEKLQQAFMLNEFLKYSKMAEHLFRVTQATKFDTANINNPYTIYRMDDAIITNSPSEYSTNLIGSATGNILENSFIGDLRNKYSGIKDVYAQAIVSEKKENAQAIQELLFNRYKRLGDRKFSKLARRIVNNIFDFSVQTLDEYNMAIGDSLVNVNNTAKQIAEFVKQVRDNENHDLHNNLIINSFQYQPSQLEGGADSIKLTGKDNKTYDQNQIIYAFAQLKDYLKANNNYDLYKGLITLSIVQSGLNNSAISFTGFIPYEDFRERYSEPMSRLNTTTIGKFAEVDAFERNNWNNPDVVSFKRPKMVYNEDGFAFSDLKGTITIQHEELQAAMERGEFPQMLNIPVKDRAARKDFLVYTWEVGTTEEKQKLKEAGDFSYIKKGLFKKVYDEQASPSVPLRYGKAKNFIYKQINAWGDGQRANEFYDHARVSQINNGFDPVEFEKADYEIAGYINEDKIQKEIRQGYQTDPTEEELQANFENSLMEDEDNFTYEEEIPEEIVPSQGVQTSDMTPQAIYKLVNRMDDATDATGLALRYIAGGGKIGEESLYKEVTAKRDSRLVPGKQTKQESTLRDFVTKDGPSISEVAHSIWEGLDETLQSKIDDQDIRNELNDVISSTIKRLEAAKTYVDRYATPDDFFRVAAPVKVAEKKLEERKIVINGQAYTERGDNLYKNNELVKNQRVMEIYAVRKEIQSGKIKITTYGDANYFVLSDNKIVSSAKATLGQEAKLSEEIKKMILDKAVKYKKTC
jgi:hypothetical protein